MTVYQYIIDAIRVEVKTGERRSAWSKGVTLYALEMLDELQAAIQHGYFAISEISDMEKLNKQLLNGARDWTEYSDGGCALIYNGDIAERLCSPSEFKKTRGGEWRPNSRETWLDVQARALNQAAARIRRAVREAKK